MKILNQEQIEVLKFLSENKFFKTHFYWTGGTALAKIYLDHRLSEDLDFFSDDLYAEELLINEINKLKKVLKIKKINYVKNKNRQIFSLVFPNQQIIKLEFVYYPFGKIKDKKLDNNYKIRIDNLKSIGENKVFALYENAEPKHAFDLYWINKYSKNLTIKKLHQGAINKFGVEIDKIVFLEKVLEATDKMAKIKPLTFPKFKVSKNKLMGFFLKIK